MGGDRAPTEPVRGALLAVRDFPDLEISLVGMPDAIEAELRLAGGHPRVSVVAAGPAIAMEEDKIVQTVRQRPDASINVAMTMVHNGNADAVVSAGNTGAVMASAFFCLGRIRGIERPALALVLPYNAGRVLLIDVGANTDCRPNHLMQFGQMGSAYSEKVIGVHNPRVGLLNVGEEAGKGNELAAEAYERLKECGVNFIGNVEGVHVHKGIADVVVTDGFTGNIALKVGEGIADYILQTVRGVIGSSPLFVGAALLLKPALKRALKRLQYEEYGGANLLGVNGVVVIAHGRSDAIAIKNALKVARQAAMSGLIETMRQSFARAGETQPAGT
jgi:glycerol-3-phosphate acyltransferase PlsX